MHSTEVAGSPSNKTNSKPAFCLVSFEIRIDTRLGRTSAGVQIGTRVPDDNLRTERGPPLHTFPQHTTGLRNMFGLRKGFFFDQSINDEETIRVVCNFLSFHAIGY